MVTLPLMFVLLTHVVFLIIVARRVSLATHWQCYVCIPDRVRDSYDRTSIYRVVLRRVIP